MLRDVPTVCTPTPPMAVTPATLSSGLNGCVFGSLRMTLPACGPSARCTTFGSTLSTPPQRYVSNEPSCLTVGGVASSTPRSMYVQCAAPCSADDDVW